MKQTRVVQLKKRACDICSSSLPYFKLFKNKKKLFSYFTWWKFYDEQGLPVTSYPPFLSLVEEYYTLKRLDEKNAARFTSHLPDTERELLVSFDFWSFFDENDHSFILCLPFLTLVKSFYCLKSNLTAHHYLIRMNN